MSKTLIYLAFSILLLSVAGAAAASLSNDPALIIYYSFDEFDDVVPDQSARGHNGEVNGDITFEEEGMHKGAAKFATNSYLDLDGEGFPAEDIPTTGITVAAWVQCEETGGDHAIFNARSGDGTWLTHPELKSGGDFRWLLRTAGGTTIFDIRAGSFEWDEWLHYAGTYDQAAGKAALYINGQAVNETAITNAAEISGDWDQGARVGLNVDNARPFTGLMDDFCLFNRALAKAEVLSIMPGLGERGPAFDPVPEEETLDVPRDVVLGWSAGPYAETHDVYLGTVLEDVNNADRANPMGVLVSESQEATTYPVELLDFDQTYYWRVDEVNAAPDYAIFKGHVWNFTTEPFAYPIQNILATSNLTSEAVAGPEKTVDGSGLNEVDEHSTRASDMWLGVSDGEEPVWIQYEFDRVYKLHAIDVWNYNAEFELILGFGIKDTTVEYSTDAVEWTTLTEVELGQATAKSTYTANTTIDGTGVAAKYVRIIASNSYGMMGQYGLSEVRFLYIPVQARGPEPIDDANNVSVDGMLSWRAGREAVSHEVYLSTDAQAVADGTALIDSVDVSSSNSGTLDFGAMYYWKVDEVNETEAIALWEGDLWSFTTEEYGVIEDFEAYNDDENRIYDTWIDGWANETGSTVGYAQEPFAERKIIHAGKQSLPLEYNNAEAPFYSEASRTWTAAQDLTAGESDSVRLYFRGDADNAPETLYLAIEDSSGQSAVVAHSDPQAALATEWQEWVVPLSEFGAVDLARVESLYVGLGNRSNPQAGGAGLVYIDDIGVGRPLVVE
jgi:concanavalin A-like lectin/glucanase superfamily protein/F5/8 type C domain-containing protein